MSEIYYVNVWAGGERPFSHQVDKKTSVEIAIAMEKFINGEVNGYGTRLGPGKPSIVFTTVDGDLVYLNFKSTPMVSCRRVINGDTGPLVKGEDLKTLGPPRKKRK